MKEWERQTRTVRRGGRRNFMNICKYEATEKSDSSKENPKMNTVPIYNIYIYNIYNIQFITSFIG